MGLTEPRRADGGVETDEEGHHRGRSTVRGGAMIPMEGRRLPDTSEYHTLDPNEAVSNKRKYATGGPDGTNCSRRRSVSVDMLCPSISRREGNRSGQNYANRMDHSIEMPQFDGVGNVELFLSRFALLSNYYSWSE